MLRAMVTMRSTLKWLGHNPFDSCGALLVGSD
jgi:hypothetical protein